MNPVEANLKRYLEWILTGNFPDRHFYAFKESILDMTERIKEYPWNRRSSGCILSEAGPLKN